MVCMQVDARPAAQPNLPGLNHVLEGQKSLTYPTMTMTMASSIFMLACLPACLPANQPASISICILWSGSPIPILHDHNSQSRVTIPFRTFLLSLSPSALWLADAETSKAGCPV